nr:SDR family NAD(P)-dependent oxidoreductase [Saprospiraceae bacterium]
MGLLSGKVALITGGSRGIGEAIVMKYAEEGADIAFTYVSSEEKALAVVAAAEQKGVRVKAYKSDASDYAQAESLVNDVVETFGKIDILI